MTVLGIRTLAMTMLARDSLLLAYLSFLQALANRCSVYVKHPTEFAMVEIGYVLSLIFQIRLDKENELLVLAISGK